MADCYKGIHIIECLWLLRLWFPTHVQHTTFLHNKRLDPYSTQKHKSVVEVMISPALHQTAGSKVIKTVMLPPSGSYQPLEYHTH